VTPPPTSTLGGPTQPKSNSLLFILLAMVAFTGLLLVATPLPARARRTRVLRWALASTPSRGSSKAGPATASPLGVAVKVVLFTGLVVAHRALTWFGARRR
jgi:hypothetical protein